MESRLLVIFVIAFLVGLAAVPPIGGAILYFMLRLVKSRPVSYVRCWMAYLAAWFTASVICTILLFIINAGQPDASLWFDLAITAGLATHLILVPLITRAGWGKAILAHLLTLVVYSLMMVPLAWPLVKRVKAQANRTAFAAQARELGSAMGLYNDIHRRLPPDHSAGPQGKPLLSWRVALLPFIEQQPLYERFRLDEPWDSPANMELLREMPALFARPGEDRATGQTHWRVFVQMWPDQNQAPQAPGLAPFGPRSRGAPNFSPDMFNIPDGAHITLMIVDSAEAVPWTKPDDLAFGPGVPLPKLGAFDDGWFTGLFFDQHYQVMPAGMDEELLRGLITADGAEPVAPP